VLEPVFNGKAAVLTTTAAPSDAKWLAIQDKTVKFLDCTRSLWFASEGDEGTPFAKVDLKIIVSMNLMMEHGAYVCDSSHDCKAGYDILKEDAGRDATNEDLSVLGVNFSPLRVELIDDNIVPLTLFPVARIGEQDEIGLVTDPVLGMSTREANWK
jgi:hypothetical protein